MPPVFDQIVFEFLLAVKEQEQEAKGGGGEWRKRGEGINEARDRLKAEREAAKQRLGVI